MKFSYLFIPLCLLLSLALGAQVTPLQKKPVPREVFRVAAAKAAGAEMVETELSAFSLLEVPTETYAQLKEARPGEWTLRLPATNTAPQGLSLHLRPRQITGNDFRIRLGSNDQFFANPDLGQHFVGEVVGEPESRVALSLLDQEITATITRPGKDRLALGKLKTNAKGLEYDTYTLFPDRQLLGRQELDCATPDSGIPYAAKELTVNTEQKSNAGCVDIFFEIDHDIFLDKGGVNAAAQHLAANFNEVAMLYEDIGVNLSISEVLVWDQPSPYSGTSSSAMLTQFQSVRTQFNGDLAQLVSYQASGGIAVLDGLCHPFIAARMSFSSIRSNFAAVPIYSWSTMVISHELGHLLGSQHTHACVWNGDNTAIDGCPGWTEGLCGTPGIPAQGGTIMSYCHLTSAGVNFNEGFGPQPAAVIINRVMNAQDCVQATCADDDGPDDDEDDEDGEGDDDPTPVNTCEEETLYLRLVLDDFGMETTWEVQSETGGVLANGGPYPKKQKGRVIRDTICLPEGCYNFVIQDDDYDGICCDYGPGRFELTDTLGNLLGIGGQFDTLAIVDFCLPDLPPDDEEDDENCIALDFVDNPVLTFGTNQDVGTVTVQENGAAIELENNAWKAVSLPYSVTENTWLSFWFKSNRTGEVHGIGLDDNTVISPGLTFQLYGTQVWGVQDFNNYPGDGEWKFYQIPVGDFYTGEANYLFFVADHDVGLRNGNSFFRDVTLSEGEPCGGAGLPAGALLEGDHGNRLDVIPNPATDVVDLRIQAYTAGSTYRVMDLAGRTMLSGKMTGESTRISVADFAAGTYVVRYENAVGGYTRRFTVVN